jgi:FAD/FMN-containing dehydrogenase
MDTMSVSRLRASISGSVIAPDDAGYATARLPWNLHEQRPALIVEAVEPSDVARTVAFAAESGLRVAAQPTGHSSTWDFEDTILIRTRGLADVTIDAAGRVAWIAGGALWRQVQGAAVAEGLAGLAGTAPHVSATGYTLGGGVGWLGRRHGLCANRLRAAELVTADGASRRVDAESDPELLWALRGGGGNYGIVTAIELELVEMGEVYAGNLAFPLSRAPEILQAWLEWVQSVPAEITSLLDVLRVPDMPMVPEPLRGAELVVVGSCHCGDASGWERAFAPLRALGPVMDTFEPMGVDGLGIVHNDPEDPIPDLGTSAVLGDVTGDTIDRLMDAVGPGSDSPLLFMELRHLGEALRQPVVPGGVRDRLDGAFLLHALGIPAGPRAGEVAPALASVRAAVAADVSGHPPLNFLHRAEDVAGSFGVDDLERLRAVKRSVDPGGIIVSSHRLDTPAS